MLFEEIVGGAVVGANPSNQIGWNLRGSLSVGVLRCRIKGNCLDAEPAAEVFRKPTFELCSHVRDFELDWTENCLETRDDQFVLGACSYAV